MSRVLFNARRKAIEVEKVEQEIFSILDAAGITDPESIKTNAGSAENLEEAICFYIHYGEYNAESIMQEITEALLSVEKRGDER